MAGAAGTWGHGRTTGVKLFIARGRVLVGGSGRSVKRGAYSAEVLIDERSSEVASMQAGIAGRVVIGAGDQAPAPDTGEGCQLKGASAGLNHWREN